MAYTQLCGEGCSRSSEEIPWADFSDGTLPTQSDISALSIAQGLGKMGAITPIMDCKDPLFKLIL